MIANSATRYHRGVLHSSNSNITIGGSDFTKNSSPIGFIYAMSRSNIQCRDYLLNDNNFYAVVYMYLTLNSGDMSQEMLYSQTTWDGAGVTTQLE